MHLTTERLTLRPWQPDEAPHLLAIRRQPDVARWLSDPRPWTDLVTAEEHIATWAATAAPPLAVLAIVPREVGHPVGTVKLNRLPGDDEVEIGWYLHPTHTGRGYAREAARRMLEEAATAALPRVWAIMWPDNAASAAVCRAIGMTDLGVRRDPWYGEEEFPDSRMFLWERPAPS